MAVYAFGSGKLGQLGTNSFDDGVEPQLVEALKGKRIISAACGEQHSLAIAEFGDVYTWGRGREGQLGTGDRINSPIPTVVKALKHEKIVSAECGHYHCVALTESGKVYEWGKLYKQNEDATKMYWGFAVEMPGMETQRMLDRSLQKYLGGSLTEAESELNNFGRFEPYTQSTPIVVEPLLAMKVVAVAAGYSCTAAVTDRGELYTWGFNEKGQLGLGHRFNQEFPKKVSPLEAHIVQVACGQQHMAVRSSKGEVFTFGLGVFGQLGHGCLDDELLPRRVETLVEDNRNIVQIACGSYYIVALTDDGKLFSWGHGEYGQHGGTKNHQDWDIGENTNSKDKHQFHATPRLLQGLEDKIVTHIACGHLHSIAVTQDEEVFTWGWGSSGCLGHGDRRFQLIPKQVTTLQGEPIAFVSAGWKHTLMVRAGTCSTFAFDFKPLLDNQAYSDIEFDIEGKIVRAHKSILYFRCPELARLKSADETQPIPIIGFKFNVVMSFLLYLYTDHLKSAPHVIGELRRLARKFNVTRLDAMCSRILLKTETEVVTIPPSQFASDMAKAVNDKESADAVFRVGEEKIYAHKVILKARCPYFARLFEGQFKEKEQFEFDVDEGISPATFLSVLSYIYSGDEVVVREDNAVELLEAADRFMMDDFQQIIEAFIMKLVEVDNVCSLLEIADKFGSLKLKRMCLEVICDSGKDSWEAVKATKAFTDLRTECPQLLREIDYRASKASLVNPGEVFRFKPLSTPEIATN